MVYGPVCLSVSRHILKAILQVCVILQHKVGAYSGLGLLKDGLDPEDKSRMLFLWGGGGGGGGFQDYRWARVCPLSGTTCLKI